MERVESGHSAAMCRMVAQALPCPARCHSDMGDWAERSTSSRMPQRMLARVSGSCGISAEQSLRPKPGRSTITVRHPSCSSSGSSLRQ